MARELKVSIVGDASSFQRALRDSTSHTSRFGSAVQKAGHIAGLAFAGLGAAAGVGLVKSTKAAIDFQSSMELIQTQAGGSTKEVKTMSKALLGLAVSVGTTPEDLSKGLYHVESAGFRGAKALSILKLAAEGAAVGHSDLEETTTALVAAQRSGIKGLGSMSQAMGSLNAIVGAGNMRMEDLTSALSTGILPAAKAFGLSISDVGAAIATMTSNGVPAVNAATGLRMAFVGMAAPTKQATGLLKSVGLSSTDLAETIRKKGLVAAFQELKDHMDKAGLSATQQGALLAGAFGKKSSTALLTLIGNIKDFGKAQEQIMSGSRDFGKAWEQTQHTAEFSLKRMQAALHVIEIEIGSALLPTLAKAAEHFARFLNNLNQAKGFQAKVDVVFGAVKGMAESVGRIAKDIADGIAAKLGQVNWSATGTKIGEAISQGIKITTKALDVALGALLSWVNSHAGKIAEVGAVIGINILLTLTDPTFWVSHWQLALGVALLALSGVVGKVGFGLIKIGGALGDKIYLGLISTHWGAAAVQVVESLISGFSKLGARLSVVVTAAAITAVRAFLAYTGQVIHAGAEWGRGVERGIGQGLANLAGTVAGAFQALWGWIKGAAGSAYAYAFSIGSGIVGGILAGLASLASRVANAISGAVKGAIGGAKGALGIHSPSTVTAKEIGKPLADGIALGFILGLNELPDKVKPSVSAALQKIQAHVQSLQSGFADAFGRLTEYALKAFDARTTAIIAAIGAKYDGLRDKVVTKFEGLREAIQTGLDKAKANLDLELDIHLAGIEAWRKELTPAEKMLKDLEDARAATGRTEAITSAQAQLAAATTPEEVKAAQKALDDALYAQRIFDLQQQANAEREIRDAQAAEAAATAAKAAQNAKDALDAKAATQLAALTAQEEAQKASLDKQQATEELNAQARRDLQRQHLEDQLAALEESLEKHPKAWKRVHKKIQNLFDQFGIDAKQAGKDLGEAFAEGLGESEAKVGRAIVKLLEAVGVKLPHSPAKEGPLSKLPNWEAYLTSGLSESVTAVNSALGGLTGVNGGAPAATGGFTSTGAGQAVVVNVYGSVTSERDLVETIRRGLLHTGRDNSSIFGQYA